MIYAILITVVIAVLLLLYDDDDPVEQCDLYKEKGCAHVDGLLCDYPNCSMNNEFRATKKHRIHNIGSNSR